MVDTQLLEQVLVTECLSRDCEGDNGAEEGIVEVIMVAFVQCGTSHPVDSKPRRVPFDHVHDVRGSTMNKA